MAHELTIRKNGFTEMAYTGERAWHKLGNELQEGASIEDWQRAAGMDWEIVRTPALYQIKTMTPANFKGKTILYRSDNHEALSVVSDKYRPVQPKEVLEFFRDLVAENGFKLHTAGTLHGGKRFWALAETGKFGEVSTDDKVGGYLLLSTSCDRTLATTARFTTVRVVCNNTLTSAVNRTANSVSFSHMQAFDHNLVKQKLGKAVDSFGAFMEMAKVLRQQEVNSAYARAFLTTLLTPVEHSSSIIYDVTTAKSYKTIMRLFEGDALGSDMAGKSKWQLLNAVTEYADYFAPARNDESRLNSALFGNGEALKNRAVDLLAV